MLRQCYRLKSRTVFRRTLAATRLCGNDCMVVYGLPMDQTRQQVDHVPHPPRFGFIVSKKVHKSAVQRNRIKRRLREIVRSMLSGPPSTVSKTAGPDRFRSVVIIARSGALSAPFGTLRQKLLGCFDVKEARPRMSGLGKKP